MRSTLAKALMNLDITATKIELEKLSVCGLREKFQEVFGYPSGSKSRPFLIRKIIWAIQAQRQGDISEKVRLRAMAIADDRDLKARLQEGTKARLKTKPRRSANIPVAFADCRLPVPGTVLERIYHDRAIRVRVLGDGFEWKGTQYKSLSAIAREATGTRWNGFGFFGLNETKQK